MNPVPFPPDFGPRAWMEMAALVLFSVSRSSASFFSRSMRFSSMMLSGVFTIRRTMLKSNNNEY
jgi:hypothetical protein